MARAREASTPRRLVIYLPHPLPIWRLPAPALERIRRAGSRVFDIDLPQNEAALARVIPEAEVLFAWGLAQRLVGEAAKLRWLHTPLAGVDRVLNRELRATNVRITSSRGVNSVAVAEHTLALVLALTRGIVAAVHAQRERRWVQAELYGRRPPLSELNGRLLGIWGLGEIGRELAVRARALGMSVWGVTRSGGQPPPGVDRLLSRDKSDTMLRAADVLVLALPLTPATEGILGERELRSLKPSAILVNIGRGALVQEPALVRALRENWILGAGLDVFADEPLPAGSPLWALRNLVLTPHVAGTHPDYMPRSADLFLKNLKLYLSSEPLLNEVDRKTGY
jgi:phosphoglycerate dehydrogenase-like enzyme